MFIDSVKIIAEAGRGGNGLVSFRKEKYIDRGGPNGGNGGRGGNIVFVASNREHTLSRFRYDKYLRALNGSDGDQNNKQGKSAPDLMVNVPVGTIVIDESGIVVADLVTEGQTEVIAKGGDGGFGNAHFKSSTRQAPLVAEKGSPGDTATLNLELKMIADVGLVGLPNAGKSTLLSVVSNAKPEIANYPFTTLRPNLGVVDHKQGHFLIADIPGLIEGASAGKGLGHDFLRHIERTSIIAHLIDIYNEDLAKTYKTIRTELESYHQALTTKHEIVVLTKIDGFDEEYINNRVNELSKVTSSKIIAISATSHHNLDELLDYLLTEIQLSRESEIVEEEIEDEVKVYRLEEKTTWEVEKVGPHKFLVKGSKIEKFAHKTNFDDYHSTVRLRVICQKMGIIHKTIRLKALPGDSLVFGDPEIGRFEL